MPGKRKKTEKKLHPKKAKVEKEEENEEKEEQSGLLAMCDELFGTKCLYGVLGVEKGAKAAQIRKGYHRLSLAVHPDRCKDSDMLPLQTKKFQTLSAVYSILSDDEKRKVYDETGIVDDGMCFESDRDWAEYWRMLFHKVTVRDIENFEKEYKGSKEELETLKNAYLEGQGSMDFIIDNVLCAVQEEDEERFSKIIRGWIKNGEVPAFDSFAKEKVKDKKTRNRKAEKEKKEAEEAAKELGIGDEDSLKKMIMLRQEQREKDTDNFLDNLATKYADKQKPGSRKKKKSK